MRVLLAGINCVGKSTVGARLAARLGLAFYDLDREAEIRYGMPIRRLYKQVPWMDFLIRMASTLAHILSAGDRDVVIALPLTGMLEPLWKVIKRNPDTITIWLQDTPENILKRITFYDLDSKPIKKSLSDEEKQFYLQQIKEDMAFFRRSFRRARLAVDISGLGVEDAALKVQRKLLDALDEHQAGAKNHQPPRAVRSVA